MKLIGLPKFYHRKSASTGEWRVGVEFAALLPHRHQLTALEIEELLVNALSTELENANTSIVNLVASNATKDATLTANAATIKDLQSQLDVANAKDAANPLNDPDAKAAADKLNATLGTLPPEILPVPAPVVAPDPAAPPAV